MPSQPHSSPRLPTTFYASLMPPTRQPTVLTPVEAARRRQEEEEAGIRLVRLLITCTRAIEAGDYSAAQANLYEARMMLKEITTLAGIGCVGNHFIDALAQLLFSGVPKHIIVSTATSRSADRSTQQFI